MKTIKKSFRTKQTTNQLNKLQSIMKTIKILVLATAIIISGNLFAGTKNTDNNVKKETPVSFLKTGLFHNADRSADKANKTLTKATHALEEIMSSPDESIPLSLLQDMEGIVIIPGALKVALGWGGQGGRGIAMIRKEDGSWSNPTFVMLGKGSWGLQIGAEASDVVLLFKDRENILSLDKAEIVLGAGVEVAAGPKSADVSANTNIKFDAETYSYCRSKGLFAGASINGGVLKSNDKMNAAFYDKEDSEFNTVFNKTETPFNDEVNDLLQSLNNYSN
jgi:lipid-binding SYLF domain-containing protein